MKTKTKRNPRGAGRPKKPAEKKRKLRAICWLDKAQKSTLQAHAKEHGLSESLLLFDGLVASGILPPDTPYPDE